MRVQWVCFLTEPPSRLHRWGRDHTRSSSSCRAMLSLLCLRRSPTRSPGTHHSHTRSLGIHHSHTHSPDTHHNPIRSPGTHRSPIRPLSRVCEVPGHL